MLDASNQASSKSFYLQHQLEKLKRQLKKTSIRLDSPCTVWFDESPSKHAKKLLVVGFSTVQRDYVVFLKPKEFLNDNESLKGEKLADFIISIFAKIIETFPNFENLVTGILSDSSPSAKVTRKSFIEKFKQKYPSTEPLVEIPCQAHAIALLEGTILKELDLVSLADKVSTCLGNFASKGSLRDRWEKFVEESNIISKKFRYRKGIRWGCDFSNLSIINKNKHQFKSFLEKNSVISKKSGDIILKILTSGDCVSQKLELMDFFKNLVNSLWGILGKNQPLSRLKKVMDNLRNLSNQLDSLYNQDCTNEPEVIQKVLDQALIAFEYTVETDDLNCVELIKSSVEFREMFLSVLSKITTKLLMYDIQVSGRDSDEKLEVVTTNVVAERCFSITKHWEARFCQLGLIQTCELAKANVNKTCDLIQNLSSQEIEEYHKRKLAKENRKIEIDEQAEYERVVELNRSKVIAEQTQKDKYVAELASIIYGEPSFIPSNYKGKFYVSVSSNAMLFSEIDEKFKRFKYHVQKSKSTKSINSPGIRKYKEAVIATIKMFTIQSDNFNSQKYIVPHTITEDYMNCILSDYTAYVQRQKN